MNLSELITFIGEHENVLCGIMALTTAITATIVWMFKKSHFSDTDDSTLKS